MAAHARSEGALDSESNELNLRECCDGSIPRSQTIRDIAKLAGVSTATVSRVMNGSDKVSYEKRTRVLALISDSQYHPNAHAIELVRGRRGNPRRRTMHEVSKVERDVQRLLAPVPAGRQEQIRKVDSLRKENVELRNLIGTLSKEIERWRKRTLDGEITTK